ncbi:ATP-dependent DNA helicase RecQ [Gracilibacillus sp. YIM 98692]|uniref:RecQ family ATP-dependent DNA helicase n=1 Tax=Gracilibacillus sp. YIM 98692 TaxID=2663532 RepID=UPI0013CF7A44|nr:ATP-dependent DNA helicase RecQ [Gracilibacillus sp. YIM 98692]
MATKNLEAALQQYFGYTSFRDGQKEIIQSVLNQKNVFAVLPTGSGKSICYQLPAMIQKGTVIVVSPLLSLMVDQVKKMKALGMKNVIAINSMLSIHTKKTVLKRLNSYDLIYVSPEMLQNQLLIEKLSQANISLFVVDEAHCISQWGHEFRPDYLRLKEVYEKLQQPPVLALTATATREVQKDIMDTLELKEVSTHIHAMDKPNISFVVNKVVHIAEKTSGISELLQQYPVPTMIYFSSKKEAESVCYELQQKLSSLRIAYYHGDLDTDDRLLIQQQFMANQLDVICCTSAFGMGIDKSDVRLVIHYHMPTQIESFIQEVGRAGRDGQPCISVLYYQDSDIVIPRRLIDSELPDFSLIRYVLNYLFTQSIMDVKELETFFLQVSDNAETKWRFLQFQLEKIGLIQQHICQTSMFEQEDVLKRLETVIYQRTVLKKRKIQEMLQWVQTSGCRRKELYKYFQPNVRTPIHMCCDHCDFDWAEVALEKRLRKEQKWNWKDKLAHLLLQGE